MKITKMHLDYWRANKAPPPTWSNNLTTKFNKPSVHVLINCQVERMQTEPHNTLQILRSMIRRGVDIIEALDSLGQGFTTDCNKRRSYCRKWRNRILKGRT